MFAQDNLVETPKDVRPIPGYPGYYAGLDGSVWTAWVSIPSGRNITSSLFPKRPYKDSHGYLVVRLTVATGERRSKRVLRHVHKLILLTFVGPKPSGKEACHKDDDKTNNIIENLRWDTHASNMAEACTNRKMAIGAKNGNNRYSKAIILRLAMLRRDGLTYREISIKSGISLSHVYMCLNGKLRKHLHEEIDV